MLDWIAQDSPADRVLGTVELEHRLSRGEGGGVCGGSTAISCSEAARPTLVPQICGYRVRSVFGHKTFRYAA